MRLYLSSYRLGTDWHRLLELVGPSRRTAVICNATDHRAADEQQQRLRWECEALESIGLEPEGLDLREYFDRPADLEEGLEPFGLVWIRGGNTFTLRRAMVASGFDATIRRRVKEDSIVYAGFSAGAIAATPTLRGTELVDEAERIPDGYRPDIIWDGLGFVDFSIVPHFRSPHPESPAMERLVTFLARNAMPYRTLRDGEAILVNGASAAVVGRPYDTSP